MEEQLDELEGPSRRTNLIFHNIPEKEGNNETWEKCKDAVLRVIGTNLDMDSDKISIERAHPIAKQGRGISGPIIVGFSFYKDKSEVLHAAKKKALRAEEGATGGVQTQQRDVFIAEDFTKRVRESRKKLGPRMIELRESGKQAYRSFDKLIVREANGRVIRHYYDLKQGCLLQLGQTNRTTK